MTTTTARTTYYTATSLDGFLADPEDSLDWLFAQQHEEPASPDLRYDALLARTGAVLMGATTYLWIRERVVAADEEQRQGTHGGERRAGQVRPPPARHDRADPVRPPCGGHQGGPAPGTGAEVTDGQAGGAGLLPQPVGGPDQSFG